MIVECLPVARSSAMMSRMKSEFGESDMGEDKKVIGER